MCTSLFHDQRGDCVQIEVNLCTVCSYSNKLCRKHFHHTIFKELCQTVKGGWICYCATVLEFFTCYCAQLILIINVSFKPMPLPVAGLFTIIARISNVAIYDTLLAVGNNPTLSPKCCKWFLTWLYFICKYVIVHV